ncbi:diaminopimelate decarboxylase [Pseudalkalibacillus caeni]|uniref:Diaminopimelate decarboxylase n=1 Tax=Exobacillus caeni TaxID=2574798 RepID=A0A5R9EZU3_9BACL|nr:diaminopimelate decarboxylase [Pseudalkalibacillus caeni]TLS35650.1 diaminopimelate decarboxylase [Pseudalkalibacillus caeni]
MIVNGTGSINEKGNLTIGGIDTVDLGKEFGTPLYIYDVELIRGRARSFKRAFEEAGINHQVAYASKAFSCMALLQVIQEENLSLDVVSGGELFTALKAGFPAEKIHFHGNNKSREEIEMAVRANIGCFVVDNFYELSLLEEVSDDYGFHPSILLRITPGVEAHTHEYITTGQEDSKFGFDLKSGQVERAIRIILENKRLDLLGLHCHIGSQIFETIGFVKAVETIYSYISKWNETFSYRPRVLNLGGGFGIRYTEQDQPIPAEEYVEAMVKAVTKHSHEQGLPLPEIWIEPGRSLVGDAGTTLYKVGSQKEIPSLRRYLAVDGGMSDNLRPALYQAKYEAVIANKVTEVRNESYSIAGKCCESGDMLIWDQQLPTAEAGDYLAVFCTGAYGYSMANNYNRLPRPAVVFVENGDAQLVVKRETYEDLISHDLPLKQSMVSKV